MTPSQSGDPSQRIPHMQQEEVLPLSHIAITGSSPQVHPPLTTIKDNSSSLPKGAHDDMSALPPFFEQPEHVQPFEVLTPFQLSGPYPSLSQNNHQEPIFQHYSSLTQDSAMAPQASLPPVKKSSPSARVLPWRRLIFSLCCIVLFVFLAILLVQPVILNTPSPEPIHTPTSTSKPTPHSQKTPQASVTATPKPKPSSTPIPSSTKKEGEQRPSTSSWIPSTLPEGWEESGLTMGDALFAQRAAVTFTDLEMSLDYRSIGTREQHAGTMVAALPMLSDGGKQRFYQFDKRMINQTLFDTLQREQVIQSVVNAHPKLVQWALTSTATFAWIEVSFELWRSHLDTGKRKEVLEPTHVMQVLLVKEINAPQGWLVSTYTLDTPGYPLVIYPV